MPYLPSKPPPTSSDDGTALAFYLEDELSRLAMSILDDVQAVEIRAAHAAPLRPREGMLVYADGTDWNPGKGEGLYTFGSDAAWHYGGQVTLPAAFHAHKNGTDQTGIADLTLTAVTFGTELYDVGSHFASSTWTPPAGKVHMDAQLFVTGVFLTDAQLAVFIVKNGSGYKQSNTFVPAGGAGNVGVSCDDIANGTDTYSVSVFADINGGTATISGNAGHSWFNGHWISA